MLILRVVLVLALCVAGASMLMYVLTRDRKYLRAAWTTARLVVVVALVFFGLLIIERLAIP